MLRLQKYKNITLKQLLFQNQDITIIPIKPHNVKGMI